MMRALWTASTGMVAQQLNVDTISNNLANVNSLGYKKTRVEFKDLLYENLERETINNAQGKPVNLQVGHGVRPAATTKFFSVGNLEQTLDSYNIAINGKGFFKVLSPTDEELYTKDGSFKLSVDGENASLVTSDGYFVQGSNGNIDLGANIKDVSIDEAGNISVKRTDNEDEWEDAGALAIINFVNPAGLESIGDNFYQKTGSSGDAIDTQNDGSGGKILQGYLESSNVQIVEEMVKLIQAQRAYEVNSKAIQTSDDMLQMANNLRR